MFGLRRRVPITIVTAYSSVTQIKPISVLCTETMTHLSPFVCHDLYNFNFSWFNTSKKEFQKGTLNFSWFNASKKSFFVLFLLCQKKDKTPKKDVLLKKGLFPSLHFSQKLGWVFKNWALEIFY